MQEKFTLTYLPNYLQQLLDDDLTINEFLEDVLTPYLEEEEDAMLGSLLSYAQNDAAGAPDVNDYELNDIEFDKETLKGSFYAEFIIYYYFGCDDMNKEDSDCIKWDFEIDTDKEEITFTGEKTLEREPDEY